MRVRVRVRVRVRAGGSRRTLTLTLTCEITPSRSASVRWLQGDIGRYREIYEDIWRYLGDHAIALRLREVTQQRHRAQDPIGRYRGDREEI